jgi:hypothetical protein
MLLVHDLDQDSTVILVKSFGHHDVAKSWWSQWCKNSDRSRRSYLPPTTRRSLEI